MENLSTTVNKAIDILEVFLQKEGQLNLTEISESTGLNVTTTHRLLSTLTRRGYLSQQKKGVYSLGLKGLDFNYAIRRNLKFIDLAYLSMSKLSKEQNMSVYMAALDAESALIIEEVGVTEDLRINSPVGKRLPLHCTACGKVFLASLSEKERKEYYKSNTLKSLTAKTITDISQLEKELKKIRTEGVAFDNEEYRMGLFIAAAPVYDGKGSVIAAAGIMVPISDIDTKSRQKFSSAIKSCTAKISQIVSRIS